MTETDGQVEPVAHHVAEVVPAAQFHLEIRMTVQKGAQHGSEDQPGKEWVDVDAQPTAYRRSASRGAAGGLFERTDQWHDLLVETAPLVRQTHRPCTALEDTDAQPAFEAGHGPADAGLGHVECFAGTAEAGHVDDGGHDVEALKQLRVEHCH